MVLNRPSSLRRSAVVEAGGGGHWLLLKCLLSVVAVSPGSEAPAAAYQTLPSDKDTLCLSFTAAEIDY